MRSPFCCTLFFSCVMQTVNDLHYCRFIIEATWERKGYSMPQVLLMHWMIWRCRCGIFRSSIKWHYTFTSASASESCYLLRARLCDNARKKVLCYSLCHMGDWIILFRSAWNSGSSFFMPNWNLKFLLFNLLFNWHYLTVSRQQRCAQRLSSIYQHHNSNTGWSREFRFCHGHNFMYDPYVLNKLLDFFSSICFHSSQQFFDFGLQLCWQQRCC